MYNEGNNRKGITGLQRSVAKIRGKKLQDIHNSQPIVADFHFFGVGGRLRWLNGSAQNAGGRRHRPPRRGLCSALRFPHLSAIAQWRKALSNMQACDRCRRRKSGCDKVQPSCGVCHKAGVTCVYTDRTKEPTIRRDVIERLERQLRQTEAKNRALTARLAASNSNPRNENISSTTRSSQVQENRNEVSDEVSFLSLNAGGERQFLGSTSGVPFADLIRSAIRADASSAPLSGHGLGPAPVSELFTKTLQPSTPIREVPPLVLESVARDLHEAYFQHDHLCYPILCQRSAMDSLTDIYADPTTLESKPYETFSFYMVMAISTTNFQKLHWQSLPKAEIYHAQAICRLNDILALGGLEALQAILLLCHYQLTSSAQRTSASLWHMVGMAARMCFEMGLHREEAYNYRGSSNTPGSTSTIHRRWLWCVLAMDR